MSIEVAAEAATGGKSNAANFLNVAQRVYADCRGLLENGDIHHGNFEELNTDLDGFKHQRHDGISKLVSKEKPTTTTTTTTTIGYLQLNNTTIPLPSITNRTYAVKYLAVRGYHNS